MILFFSGDGLFVGAALSMAHASSRERVFEATAVLQIDAAKSLAHGSQADLLALVRQIEERLTSHENLTGIMDRHGLWTGSAAPDRQIADLRSAMEFLPQDTGIRVTARLPDAQKAARVANDLAQILLDLTTAAQLTQARRTAEFYRNEATRLQASSRALLLEVAQASSAPATFDILPAVADRLALVQTSLTELAGAGAQAEAGLALTEGGLTARLILLDRALTPQTPVPGPGRAMLVAGIGLSAALAMLAGFLTEWARPRLRTADHMERHLGFRPLVVIPDIGAANGPLNRVMRLVDDPDRPVLGLPRFAVFATLAAALLLALAAAIG